jgi:AbrB family looped-hinge helix DNA binding protein
VIIAAQPAKRSTTLSWNQSPSKSPAVISKFPDQESQEPCYVSSRVAMIVSMTVKIDRAGRVALPKTVRERLGLKAGVQFEVFECPDGLVLRRVRSSPSMVYREGFLVHRGKLADEATVARFVAEDREERMRKAGGW